MKRVRVEIGFYLGDTGEYHAAGKEIEVSEDVIERAKAINPNMLTVLGEAKKPRAKKAE